MFPQKHPLKSMQCVSGASNIHREQVYLELPLIHLENVTNLEKKWSKCLNCNIGYQSSIHVPNLLSISSSVSIDYCVNNSQSDIIVTVLSEVTSLGIL
jgi:hypothetical protein